MDDIDIKLEAMARKAYICPRCGGSIPTNENPGAYPGALSRADNETYICSACGTHEAMQQFGGSGLTPIGEWPITGDDLADLRKYEELNRQARDAAMKLRDDRQTREEQSN